MPSDFGVLQIASDRALSVAEPGETVTITSLSGDTIYYGDRNVTAAANAGTLAPGQSVVVTPGLDWMRSASQSMVSRVGITPSGIPLVEVQQRNYSIQSWAFDVAQIGNGVAPIAGTVYLRAIPFRAGQIITSTVWSTIAVGAGTVPTHIYTGLCDATGKMLAQSADLAASSIWTAAANALCVAPLTGPVVIAADGIYYAAFLQVGAWGTTQMTLGQKAIVMAAALCGVMTGGAAQAALPANGASLTFGGGAAVPYWAAAA